MNNPTIAARPKVMKLLRGKRYLRGIFYVMKATLMLCLGLILYNFLTLAI